jgi:excinuclease UvrABC helicase subunit UvrB
MRFKILGLLYLIKSCLAFDFLIYSSYFQVKDILEEILRGHAKKTSKVLLVVASDRKAEDISSSLKRGNCTVIDDSHNHSFTLCRRFSH